MRIPLGYFPPKHASVLVSFLSFWSFVWLLLTYQDILFDFNTKAKALKVPYLPFVRCQSRAHFIYRPMVSPRWDDFRNRGFLLSTTSIRRISYILRILYRVFIILSSTITVQNLRNRSRTGTIASSFRGLLQWQATHLYYECNY